MRECRALSLRPSTQAGEKRVGGEKTAREGRNERRAAKGSVSRARAKSIRWKAYTPVVSIVFLSALPPQLLPQTLPIQP
eukprot:3886747-Pleurochrysis_carterae.AAC.1